MRSFPSALAGEGGARAEGVGGRGGVLARVRSMRRTPTEAERALWHLLRAHHFAATKWKRQQPLGRYIVDFVCFERRLIVEADGSQHADNAYDAVRDAWLRAQPFTVLHFWNDDILNNAEGLATAILTALKGNGAGIEPAPPPPPLPGPPPQGGRESMEL